MFTGIVQEKGEIRESTPAGKAVRFSFGAPVMAAKVKAGDSVCCDGVCLTVEQCDPLMGHFSVCAVPETLSKTTLSDWKVGRKVNLESALTLQTPLGGHFVMGHVDDVCDVVAASDLPNGEGCELTVRLPEEFLRYCVYKGSLTLSGVSLTIAAVDGDLLRFALIPHTLQETTFASLKAGDRLNFEVDMLAKYVERQLATGFRGHASLQPIPSFNESDLEKWGYGVS